MPGRVQILANPVAGGGRGAEVAPELARALTAKGFECTVQFTQQAGDARAFATRLDAETHHAVVAVGGDGTINEVVGGLPMPSPRLAVLPLGTANVLAAELGLTNSVTALADILEKGHTKTAAIARADDRRFLLFAGFGFDARMAARLAEVRGRRGGKTKWIGPVWHVIRTWPRDRILVEDEAGETHGPFGQVVVTRVRNYGGWFHLPGDIDIEDGLLHAVCFRQNSRLAYLAATWRAWRNRLRVGKDVEVLHGDAFRVTGAAGSTVPSQVDGDPHGATPTAVSLERDAKVQLLIP